MTAAADRLRQHGCFCGNCPSPSDCEGRDLALLCADMADALAEWHQGHHPFCDTNDGGDTCDCSHDKAAALLARLDTLTAAAGPV